MDQVFEGGTKIYSNDLVKIFLFQEKSDDNWSMGPVQQEVGGEGGGVQWESRPGPGGRRDPIVPEAPLELTNLNFQHLVEEAVKKVLLRGGFHFNLNIWQVQCW